MIKVIFIRSALRLISQSWTRLSHRTLTQSAGTFGSFITSLSQVLEVAVTSSVRDPRPQRGAQGSGPSYVESSGSHSSSSGIDTSSNYSGGSVQTDQSSADQLAKSESTANFCVYELLSCVTGNGRGTEDPPFCLEWSSTHTTLHITA